MRVVGGYLRGRKLSAPRGMQTRPTSDRVREALFSILEARHGDLSGAIVLDLFAGTGALGIEALSHGAAHATFVESDAKIADLIRRNVASLGLTDKATVIRADALRLNPHRLSDRAFSLLLVDPPYRIEPHEVVQAVITLGAEGCLAPGATVAYELSTSRHVQWPHGFTETVEKTYGSTRLSIARWKGSVDG